MTQQILFILVILIGAAYARKYGKKAKSDIEKFQQNKAKEDLNNKLDYLDRNIFYGLTNQNNGFDSASINYFTEEDFKIVLERAEKLNIGIAGIEPWLNGAFYDAVTAEDFGGNASDPNWYTNAFEKFKAENKNLLYAASYVMPSAL